MPRPTSSFITQYQATFTELPLEQSKASRQLAESFRPVNTALIPAPMFSRSTYQTAYCVPLMQTHQTTSSSSMTKHPLHMHVTDSSSHIDYTGHKIQGLTPSFRPERSMLSTGLFDGRTTYKTQFIDMTMKASRACGPPSTADTGRVIGSSVSAGIAASLFAKDGE